MKELDRIVVATDLQGATDTTMATAVMLARAYGSRILLLHVIPDVPSDAWSDDGGPESIASLLEELRSRIEKDGATVEEVVVKSGKASYRICQYAEQKSANLIVVGASEGGRPDVHLGVTARRVIRNSVKPVWLSGREVSGPPSSILCPVDGSSAAHRALENAIRLARQFAAQLTVIRVREAMPEVYARMMRPDDLSPAREVEQLRSWLKDMVGEYDVADVKINTQVREGVAHAEVLSAVAELNCDLIVMGAEGMSNPPRGLIGSVTQKVARTMPCSILVVTEEDVLAARLRAAIDSISGHMREGESLLQAGIPLESLAEYEQCLLEEPTYAPAWEGLAAAYESLGDLNKAERCREWAERIRQTIW